MKKILAALLILAATSSSGYGESEMWRNAGQACVFGGSVLGVTSIVVLYPAIAVGTNSIPVTSLILGNTLFGCGISAIGAAAAYGFGMAYDRVFGPETKNDLKHEAAKEDTKKSDNAAKLEATEPSPSIADKTKLTPITESAHIPTNK